MLMIIFGAGASFGSRPVNEPTLATRPPLAAGLVSEDFGRYTSEYPSSRPVIVRLRRALVEGDGLLETELGRVSQDASTDPERARHLLSFRFYLNHLVESVADGWWNEFDGFTHYAELLERIGAWRSAKRQAVCLVTFNYDTLLDRSADAQVGNWTLRSFDSYVERPDWRLYKLHGSTHWSRVLPSNVEQNETPPNVGYLIQHAEQLDFENGELVADPWAFAVPLREKAVAAPGIAVPTDLKQTFCCPPDHVKRFTRDIEDVDRLLLIGWRAVEPHALDLLVKHLTPGYNLAICDVDEASIGQIRHALGAVADIANRVQLPFKFTGGFSELVHPRSQLEFWLDMPPDRRR